MQRSVARTVGKAAFVATFVTVVMYFVVNRDLNLAAAWWTGTFAADLSYSIWIGPWLRRRGRAS
jgi:hypothetical protein